jgi:hypothetical protein
LGLVVDLENFPNTLISLLSTVPYFLDHFSSQNPSFLTKSLVFKLDSFVESSKKSLDQGKPSIPILYVSKLVEFVGFWVYAIVREC